MTSSPIIIWVLREIGGAKKMGCFKGVALKNLAGLKGGRIEIVWEIFRFGGWPRRKTYAPHKKLTHDSISLHTHPPLYLMTTP